MSSRKWLWVMAFAAVSINVVGAQPALADPLTPLTSGENQYLDQLHRVFAANHDPTAFRSDGELLADGQFVCAQRNVGRVGTEATFKTPAIIQLAFIYLCP